MCRELREYRAVYFAHRFVQTPSVEKRVAGNGSLKSVSSKYPSAAKAATEPGGAIDERCTSFGRDAQGRVHSDGGWQAREVGHQRPALCWLGNVSPQRLAREHEPVLRVSFDRLVGQLIQRSNDGGKTWEP